MAGYGDFGRCYFLAGAITGGWIVHLSARDVRFLVLHTVGQIATPVVASLHV
jgi:hypothetical protein